MADLLRVARAPSAGPEQHVLAGVPDGTPGVINGRDGKAYHYPATSVENPSVARIAGRILAELGDDAPEGGASLRTLNKRLFEMGQQELLGRTSPALPRDFRLHALDFRKLGNRIAPGVCCAFLNPLRQLSCASVFDVTPLRDGPRIASEPLSIVPRHTGYFP